MRSEGEELNHGILIHLDRRVRVKQDGTIQASEVETELRSNAKSVNIIGFPTWVKDGQTNGRRMEIHGHSFKIHKPFRSKIWMELNLSRTNQLPILSECLLARHKALGLDGMET